MKLCEECNYPNPDERDNCFKCGATIKSAQIIKPQQQKKIDPLSVKLLSVFITIIILFYFVGFCGWHNIVAYASSFLSVCFMILGTVGVSILIIIALIKLINEYGLLIIASIITIVVGINIVDNFWSMKTTIADVYNIGLIQYQHNGIMMGLTVLLIGVALGITDYFAKLINRKFPNNYVN